MKRTVPGDLRSVQELVWKLLSAPQGVEQGAEALVASGAIPTADLGFLVEPSRRLTPAGCLDIYANMYFYRLRDALAEDYPKLVAVLGGARFHNLVTDFLLAHPPSRPALRHLGAMLPAFLAAHPLAQEQPFLADLARLEWARLDLFDEADATVLTREVLSAWSPADARDRLLALVPACRLLELEWSVAPLWRAIEDELGTAGAAGSHSGAVEAGDEFIEPFALVRPPSRGRFFVRAWRQEFTVCHRSMPADESACLHRLGETGASLDELAAELLGASGETAAPSTRVGPGEHLPAVTRRLAALMDLWMADGVIRTAPPG
ncbi:MAG: putative DNA-binding domain-containing protein [Acidobacteriota bacterium]